MKWLNIIALTAVVIVNALANALPINDMTTGEVAALYPNLFTPAGITFSIWSVIYLALAGYCAFPFLSPAHNRALSISWLFIATCIFNISWIIAWHYLIIELSLLIMLLLLLTLCFIYYRLHQQPAVSQREKWLLYKPFSIYLAWISVATVANTTALLVHYDFNPPTPENWPIAAVIAILWLVYVINRKYMDVAFSLVIIWAFVGIIIRRVSEDPLFSPLVISCVLAVILTAWIAMHYRFRSTLN